MGLRAYAFMALILLLLFTGKLQAASIPERMEEVARERADFIAERLDAHAARMNEIEDKLVTSNLDTESVNFSTKENRGYLKSS